MGGILSIYCVVFFSFSVTGKTLAENAELFPALSEGQVLSFMTFFKKKSLHLRMNLYNWP